MNINPQYTLCLLIFFNRASNDLKSHLVAADTMEQFQKELDSGKVRSKHHPTQKGVPVFSHTSY